jgi:hypothetical protein
MTRNTLALLVAFALGAGSAYGQEGTAGAGRFEVGAFPGGAIFFTESGNGTEPNFGNYALGGSMTFNVNRYVGVEGEGGGTVGVRQNFTAAETAFVNQRTPGMWMYHGNVIVNPLGNDRAFVPYATGGAGGLTMAPWGDVDALGVTTHETYLTGNVGGGLKWFSTQRFGVRGDYRFFAVRNKDTAPWFFGNENRFGHRVQAGLIFTY